MCGAAVEPVEPVSTVIPLRDPDDSQLGFDGAEFGVAGVEVGLPVLSERGGEAVGQRHLSFRLELAGYFGELLIGGDDLDREAQKLLPDFFPAARARLSLDLV